MAKKRAYETYYRDKFGELKVRLVDAETGKPVTDKKNYTVVDSTEVQAEEVTGNPTIEENDAGPTPAMTGSTEKIKEAQKVKRFAEGGDRGKRTGKGTKGNVSNNFGFINKPSWSKYVASAVGMVNPMAGMAVKAIDMGVNANNVGAINQAREFLGLEPMSTKDVLKGTVKGVDDGMVGDVDVAGTKRGVSFGGAVIDGKTTMTPQEARTRNDIKAMQDKVHAGLVQRGFQAKAKLHPELDPMTDTNSKKGVKGKGLAGIGKQKGLPTGLDMVDGYRAKLSSVNFDAFDLDPVTKEKAKEFQAEAKKQGLDFAVDVQSMVRTQEEQNATVARGKSRTKKSEHMAAMALDISPVDDQDQAGWAAKRSLAESLGWGQLDPSWDPAHMGLTKSNTQPGALDISKEDAIDARDYFGNVPMTSERREKLGLIGGVPTPEDRPTTAPATARQAMTPKEAFYSEHYAYAKEAGLTGVMADIAVSQAALETGYGTGVLNKEANNYHGMKAGKSWAGKTFTVASNEEENGVMSKVDSSFRSYKSPVESYKDWAAVMEKNFPGVLTAKDLPEAIAGLENGVLGKYATDSDYGIKLSKTYNEARSFAPVDIDPNASPFSKYSAGFYSAIQKQPDAQTQANKARRDSANRPQIAQMDSTTGPQSAPAGIAATPGASSTANFGRTDSPSSGRPSSASFGNAPGAGFSSPGMGKGPGSPGTTGRSGMGAGMGSSGVGKAPGSSTGNYSGKGGLNSPSEGARSFGGSPASRSVTDGNKDKDRSGSSTGSKGPSGGGYGGWGGPR